MTPSKKQPSRAPKPAPANRKSSQRRKAEHKVEPVSIRWTNFRGFTDTGEIALRPLTIILGANNSGKSSLLAPLLMMKQTLSSRDTRTALLSRGQLADVGYFRDFSTNHKESASIGFNIYFHIHPPGSKKSPKILDHSPGALELQFTDGGQATPGVRLDSFRVLDVHRREYLTRKLQPDGRYALGGPLRGSFEKRGAELALQSALNTKPSRFLFGPILQELFRIQDNDEDQFAMPSRQSMDAVFAYERVLASVQSEISALLDRTAYIGPMRERPQRYYEHTGDKPETVGPRGEHAAEIYSREYATIAPAMSEWVRRFGFAEKINVNPPTLDGVFSLELESKDVSFNIADSGFGISQLFPILVEGCREGPRRMILKQPEIHLNPRQQCVLADFLGSLASKPGTLVLVETHSEHLLLSLRRAIAEGAIASQKVAVYFVERREGHSSVRAVPIDQKGHIASDDWPADFLNDGLREALRLTAAQAKSQ